MINTKIRLVGILLYYYNSHFEPREVLNTETKQKNPEVNHRKCTRFSEMPYYTTYANF